MDIYSILLWCKGFLSKKKIARRRVPMCRSQRECIHTITPHLCQTSSNPDNPEEGCAMKTTEHGNPIHINTSHLLCFQKDFGGCVTVVVVK